MLLICVFLPCSCVVNDLRFWGEREKYATDLRFLPCRLAPSPPERKKYANDLRFFGEGKKYTADLRFLPCSCVVYKPGNA